MSLKNYSKRISLEDSQGFAQAKDERADRQETSDHEKAHGNASLASCDGVYPTLCKFTRRLPALYTLTTHENLGHQQQITFHANN